MKAFLVDLSAKWQGGIEYNSHARLILAESEQQAEEFMMECCLLAYPTTEGHSHHKVAIDEIPFAAFRQMYQEMKR